MLRKAIVPADERKRPFMLLSQRCCEQVSALRFERHRRWAKERLRESVQLYNLTVLDYLIHEHGLAVLCDPEDLSRAADVMKRTKGTIAADIRRRKGGEGTVWRGRYGITLLQPEALLPCMLTLALHPVAEGAVVHPAMWNQSGWSELAGLRRRYRITSSDLVFETLAQGKRHFSPIYQEGLRWPMLMAR